MSHQNSESLYQRALELMPGGVNSPVRAFRGVGGTPIFFDSAEGAMLTDVDGNKYIDYVSSWGPMIRGFSNEEIVTAVIEQARKVMSVGAPTALEVDLAAAVVGRIPSMDKIRMVNSGTEATMSAIRLARGYTGRDKILKFQGCFHGHGDSLLVKAGSGVLTLGLPDSPGVPGDLAQHTLTAPFNDTESVDELFEKWGDSIAGVIVEPIAGNMGCVLPEPGFLQHLRDVTDRYGSLLIFDEVMTGFRVSHGGAQELHGVNPDLTTLGKVIGGGMPVGAYGGTARIMDHVAPVGPVYQSGTLSGNPVAMASGLATIAGLNDEFYANLQTRTDQIVRGLRMLASDQGVAMHINDVCGMFGIFFTEQDRITSYDDVSRCSSETYSKFFHAMLDQGVYFAPSAYEVAFVGSQHSEDIVDATLAAAKSVFSTL